MPVNALTDAAWSAIVRARGAVRGKALFMSRGTMAAIIFDRGEIWNPAQGYRLYDVPVFYDDQMPYGIVVLKRSSQAGWRMP